jgi:FtsP/CotA-like multicopper oxidase with cupredoxin domain
MPRTVRRVLITLAVLALVPVLALGGLLAWTWQASASDLRGTVDFRNALPVPPIADSEVVDGVRVFDLTMQRGSTDFGTGTSYDTLGLDGDYLGPTLRAERGEQVRVDVTNEIGERSTLHWHGMHLPAAMDGGPHQMVEVDQTWSPTWRLDQPAATLWYHPHLHGETADHVYRGLAGLFLVDDEGTASLDLPGEYGVDDVPLVVQDKVLDDGRLGPGKGIFNPVGTLGDTLVVNGVVAPYLDVTTERVRLRLLNASSSRVFDFALDDGRPLDLVATDGGLLAAPERLSHVRLSPGERAEVVVQVEPGERAALVSLPTKVAGDPFQQRYSGGDDAFDVVELRAADDLAPSPDVPARLAAPEDLSDDEVAATREFRLSTPRINGRSMDMRRIDEVVEVGSTERWVVTNTDGTPHSFHLHDAQAQVVSYDGGPPPAHLRGRKDTVFLPGPVTVELLVRFDDFTDPDVPYMFHCHVLQHEDDGMMGQFVVVRPGEQAGTPPPAGPVSTPGDGHGH